MHPDPIFAAVRHFQSTRLLRGCWQAYLSCHADDYPRFWFGIQKRDNNIYLPCIGWML